MIGGWKGVLPFGVFEVSQVAYQLKLAGMMIHYSVPLTSMVSTWQQLLQAPANSWMVAISLSELRGFGRSHYALCSGCAVSASGGWPIDQLDIPHFKSNQPLTSYIKDDSETNSFIILSPLAREAHFSMTVNVVVHTNYHKNLIIEGKLLQMCAVLEDIWADRPTSKTCFNVEEMHANVNVFQLQVEALHCGEQQLVVSLQSSVLHFITVHAVTSQPIGFVDRPTCNLARTSEKSLQSSIFPYEISYDTSQSLVSAFVGHNSIVLVHRIIPFRLYLCVLSYVFMYEC
jgi:hypothetical protein